MAPPHRTRVVCGIDPNGDHAPAVRHACALAGPGGHVALVCVLAPDGHPTPPALAGAALEQAMRQTRAARVASSAYVIRSAQAAAVVLRAGADGDAVVVGAHHWPTAV
jgi:hypothetical protein